MALIDSHPEAGRKGHNPTANINIPLTFSNAPVPPDAEATDEEKTEWAAWALGNFYPYDRMLSLLKGHTLWRKYKYWRRHKVRGAADDVAFHLLDNMILAAHAREAIRARDKDTRVRRSQMRAAGLDHKVYEHDGGFSTAAHDGDFSQEFDLHPDCNGDEDAFEHIQSLLAPGPDDACAGAADQYLADAVAVIAQQPLPPASTEDAASDSCARAGHGTREALNAAIAAMKEARPGRLKEMAPETLEERHRLRLCTHHSTGKVYCKLVYAQSLPLAANEAELIKALNTKLKTGAQPPY